MKNKYAVGIWLTLMAVPAVASAEMIMGTVTNIDPASSKLTLMRYDNSKTMTVSIADENALTSLQTGSSVELDAHRRLFGGWKADTVSPSSGSNSAAQENSTAAAEGQRTNP